jgi:hypothetical protein
MALSTLLLTFALVAITGYYAWQTQQMVKEMRRSRELGVLPRITLDLGYLGPVYVTPVIRNVGAGPALNADLTVTFEPADPDNDAPVVRELRRNVIAPGEQFRLMPPDDGPGRVMPTQKLAATYVRIRATGTMADSLGQQHQVDEVFEELEQWRQLLGDLLLDEHPVAKAIDKLSREVKELRGEVAKIRREAERPYLRKLAALNSTQAARANDDEAAEEIIPPGTPQRSRLGSLVRGVLRLGDQGRHEEPP